MKQNGQVTEHNPPTVWTDDSTTGLDTIRKIILAKYAEDTELKLKAQAEKYEFALLRLQARLDRQETEFAQKIRELEENYQLRFDELKSNFFDSIQQVEHKTVQATKEKENNFGKILIQLGKEWSLNKEKE
ncbi:MAG TPA: hypothetical protein ENK85_11775 [Saprospiraceae bacterium]|nr:hypothetical protein [Saprospiraceae bacterium]